MTKKALFLVILSIACPLPREMTTVYLTVASNVHHFLQIFQVFDITNLMDSRFLRFCSALYTIETIRGYDRNHLIFGPRFDRPSGTPDWIIEIAGEYFDVLLCNRFITSEIVEKDLAHWHNLSGRPILICDHRSNSRIKEMNLFNLEDVRVSQ